MIENKVNRIDPKLFLLYIAMASMIMFFSSQFSALIVKKGDYKHWIEMSVPSYFLYSTILIIISSFTIQMAKVNIQNKSKFSLYGYSTLILAILFVYCQYQGWNELGEKQIFLNGHPSGSFIYFISLMHGLHYVGGILFLTILVFKYRKSEIDFGRIMNFNILTQYWHFIGIVWVIIYLFFKLIIYN